jgi:CheY-like chemotaxis protein
MSLPNFENKNFLVVEDDEMSFLYLNQLLLLSKATYKREKNGKDAITEFINNNNYDLVLMDIQLPDMNGMEVTRKIRQINPLIPVIAQTASRSTDEKEQILEAGCTDILTKPFSVEEFFNTLVKALKG